MLFILLLHSDYLCRLTFYSALHFFRQCFKYYPAFAVLIRFASYTRLPLCVKGRAIIGLQLCLHQRELLGLL